MTEYYQGKYAVDYLYKNKKISSSLYKKLLSIPELSKMFLKTENNNPGNILVFKIIKDWDTIEKIASYFDSKKLKITQGDKIDINVIPKIRLYLSGGRLKNVIDENGNTKSSKSPKTAQQEDAVILCLRINKFDPNIIRNKIKFPFDKTWMHSFEQTYLAITNKLKINPSLYNIYRSSDKNKPRFLNLMTDDKILPDKKDNWNPSDIWLVKKGYNGDDILKIVNQMKRGEANITDLNEIINKHFLNKKLIGISLKKVTNSTATVKKVEIDLDYIKKIKFKGIYKKPEMSVLNSYFDIYFEYRDPDIKKYLIRFRPRGKSGSLNVYFEGKPPNRKNWDGAISRNMLEKKFFNGLLGEFENTVKNMDIEDETVLSVAEEIDKDYANFLKNPEYLKLKDLNKTDNEYKIKRGLVNSFALYLISQQNQEKFFKDCLLSAMKMNDFSSVHYKIY